MKKYPDIYAYPAIFKKVEGKMWEVWFPDIENCFTSTDSKEQAILEARYVLEDILYGMEKQKFEIPAPSDPANVEVSGPQDFVQLVVADMPPVRREHSNRAVKKTLTIPAWMEEELKKRKDINVSQVLQDALKEQLQA